MTEDAAWEKFRDGLALYLGLMDDPDDEDHLRIELPDPAADFEDGCRPYVQFATFGAGQGIRAEVSGNAYLLPNYRLGAAGCAALSELGWSGNEQRGDPDDKNWSMERPMSDTDEVADKVAVVLQHVFGIAHPQLLTHDAWGPASPSADVLLELCATDQVPADLPTTAASAEASTSELIVLPADRDELLSAVAAVLREKYDEEASVDDDGDFVLDQSGQLAWVRVRTDQPAVEILARIVHDVRSRRATAVELSLLNRDNIWVHWTLVERTVWQGLALPGHPFVPQHLDAMLDLFFKAAESHRDDLAYRLGAKVR
ncbi:hypothetical protein K8W59_06610 [Nocardioides rotundus]|uniref:T3SS (YopN, CesT) and YbjN peptide-binding chaperone 1 n=1 Tax=Nocardioides rotundus TaxID=1774216 RepID=UPI001CC0DDFD|nr:YbjN domain-containing protein [Nocardioides rotundus]UAL31138.1 hypothetical protein K8W59_06610 [Nocardioides rotundus]